jgi:type I restriction enzyme S subunit
VTKQGNGSPIPENWKWTTVGEIYDVVGGGTPSTTKPEYWNGNIPWITSADIIGLNNITPRKCVTLSGVENSATNIVPEKSIIIVTRVGLGKLGITKTKICFSQDCHALIGNNSLISPEYALYYLSTAVKEFKYKNRGTTISGVTKKQLCQLSFPLSPFNEQMMISSKVEELFSFLDAGTKSLRKVQAQLKRYRQAVLKYAFEGKLTEKWRAENKDRLNQTEKLLKTIREKRLVEKSNNNNANSSFGVNPCEYPYGIPTGWIWCKVEDISLKVTQGPNPKYDLITNSSLRVLKTKDLYDDVIHYDKADEVSSNVFAAFQKFKLVDGDVLIGLVGVGSTGKCNVFREQKNTEFIFTRATGLIRLVDRDLTLPEYLHSFLVSRYGKKILESITGGSTGQLVIKTSLLKTLLIPLASVEEQCKMVEEIGKFSSIVEKMERDVIESLKNSERLRQSILSNAFAGKLIAQDPGDEPAEILLKRIREAKNYQAKNNSEGLMSCVK